MSLVMDTFRSHERSPQLNLFSRIFIKARSSSFPILFPCIARETAAEAEAEAASCV